MFVLCVLVAAAGGPLDSVRVPTETFAGDPAATVVVVDVWGPSLWGVETFALASGVDALAWTPPSEEETVVLTIGVDSVREIPSGLSFEEEPLGVCEVPSLDPIGIPIDRPPGFSEPLDLGLSLADAAGAITQQSTSAPLNALLLTRRRSASAGSVHSLHRAGA